MRTFTISVWPFTLWAMAIITSLMAGSHNGAWLIAFILWAAGLALIIRRWVRSIGSAELPPSLR